MKQVYFQNSWWMFNLCVQSKRFFFFLGFKCNACNVILKWQYANWMSEWINGPINVLMIGQAVNEFKTLHYLGTNFLTWLITFLPPSADIGASFGMPSIPISAICKPFHSSSCLRKSVWQSDKGSGSRFRRIKF